MANPNPSKPFTKGDPRINRKGRPKSFDGLRELAQLIGHEAVSVGDKKLTVTEAILRQWAQSKNPILQRAFIEIAFGKVPDRTELTGADGKPLKIKVTLSDGTGY
jgi:hypothetical protein